MSRPRRVVAAGGHGLVGSLGIVQVHGQERAAQLTLLVEGQAGAEEVLVRGGRRRGRGRGRAGRAEGRDELHGGEQVLGLLHRAVRVLLPRLHRAQEP